ncbi:SpoIIE family protein phosphatase [Parvicella tangerina]|uniref:PPM-type phosphatase domain-containing protein n=1 Tax=Parvicella tangerina TaxID=2829795 RepID=A0A916NI15_9FLAO|nr:SpoIIE family protein phosphatase [Parvicella tangerina]CAG5082855.1 hypothetical protein CRYO30217_02027 [Parvicella tangerina]
MEGDVKHLVFDNLVAFAYSDGLEEREREFLFKFAEENGIDKDYAEKTIATSKEFIIPEDTETKRTILNYMIDLAMVDGNFSSEELEMCNNFVNKLGLDASMTVLTTKLLHSLNQIDEQKMIIARKNKDIEDSLNAAKNIQRAILPSDNKVKELLPDSFVLYLPKDIVSGDFYWVEPMKTTNGISDDDVVFVSAVDCTGHGVPGAFMSIVGYNGLNRSLKEFGLIHPDEILEMLNTVVGENLNEGDNQHIRNGMDISLCKLNKRTFQLEYAGAKNSVYVVKPNNGNQNFGFTIEEKHIHVGATHSLYEIKADRHSIGANTQKGDFTNRVLQLEKGDTFYITSDGYVDQNGGPKDKKFRPQALRQMLLSIQEMDMQEQNDHIHQTIKNWMGDAEQRDDMVVIGVRV